MKGEGEPEVLGSEPDMACFLKAIQWRWSSNTDTHPQSEHPVIRQRFEISTFFLNVWEASTLYFRKISISFLIDTTMDRQFLDAQDSSVKSCI